MLWQVSSQRGLLGPEVPLQGLDHLIWAPQVVVVVDAVVAAVEMVVVVPAVVVAVAEGSLAVVDILGVPFALVEVLLVKLAPHQITPHGKHWIQWIEETSCLGQAGGDSLPYWQRSQHCIVCPKGVAPFQYPPIQLL